MLKLSRNAEVSLEIEIARGNDIFREPGLMDLENFRNSTRSPIPNHQRGNAPVVRLIRILGVALPLVIIHHREVTRLVV